jgi:uncharacterized protein (DUF305 family)
MDVAVCSSAERRTELTKMLEAKMRISLALVVAFVLSLSLASVAAGQMAGRDPAPDPRMAQLEIDFMMGMIPHHRDAIMMAEMALMKATRPELREQARREIEAQGAEIERMSAFLRDWYGMEPPMDETMSMEMMRMADMPMLHGLAPDMMARMHALEAKSGAEFDIEFMSAMIEHHAQAIAMASAVLMRGHHEDLIALAQDIVIDQVGEIRDMDRWLKEWYGLRRPLW